MFWTADRIYSQGIEQAQKEIYEFFLDAAKAAGTGQLRREK